MAAKRPGHRVIVDGTPASGTTKMGYLGEKGGRPGNAPPQKKLYGKPAHPLIDKGY